jgi:hypothetical protein
MMDLKSNFFYVACEKTVYICWEKISGLSGYEVFRDGVKIADSDENEFVRPYEFDNDHHTELFVDQSSHHWLRFRDTDVKNFTHYSYRVTAFNEIGEVIATSIKPVDTE